MLLAFNFDFILSFKFVKNIDTNSSSSSSSGKNKNKIKKNVNPIRWLDWMFILFRSSFMSFTFFSRYSLLLLNQSIYIYVCVCVCKHIDLDLRWIHTFPSSSNVYYTQTHSLIHKCKRSNHSDSEKTLKTKTIRLYLSYFDLFSINRLCILSLYLARIAIEFTQFYSKWIEMFLYAMSIDR